METLSGLLLNVSLEADKPDIRRPIAFGRKLSTAYFYQLLTFRGMDCPVAPFIWDKIIPKRHRIFLWIALRDRHNTRDNMLRKQWTRLVKHNGCDRCPAAETMHHIMLRCQPAHAVWSKAGLLDPAVSATTISDFITSSSPQIRYGRLWNIFLAACAVTLWRARNAQVFHDDVWHISTRILKEIAELLMLWRVRAPGAHHKEFLRTWANEMCHS